jgi:hypothetical protein
MERIATELPSLLENAMRQSQLSGAEEMKARLQRARESRPGGEMHAA